jgi:N-acetylmuramoyl-L-alanine amidase
MINPSEYPAVFSKVYNRGIPPVSFIETLVYAMRKLPDEIFGTDYRSRTEDDIYSWLHKQGEVSQVASYGRRRAIMCEVLRVLGGFESSWDWKAGRDVTNASSNRPETTEAGIFQCSANSVNFDASLIACFSWYAYVYEMPAWVDMKKSGFNFQWMSKNVPGYAIEHCVRLLRFTIRHHGPILRGEILPWISLDGIREFESLLSNTPMSTTPTAPATKNLAYVIDPGHGGQDSGAVGIVDGKTHMEKTIVLDVVDRLFSLMDADGRFTTLGRTRSRDEFISLADRAKFANSLGAKLVSIHANAGGGTGFECFTTPGQTESDKLATSLLSHYAGEFAEWATRYDMTDGDPDKEARFTVLTATKETAVLFELGFMDRPEDLRRMTAPDFAERAARALYLGILQHESLAVPGSTDATEEADPVNVPIESAEAAAFARGMEEGVAAAIKKFDDLARDNANFQDFKPTESAFWQGQRNYVTGYLAADFLRKAAF